MANDGVAEGARMRVEVRLGKREAMSLKNGIVESDGRRVLRESRDSKMQGRRKECSRSQAKSVSFKLSRFGVQVMIWRRRREFESQRMCQCEGR